MEALYGIMGGTILGWLLGLFSPSLIKRISKETDRKNLEKIIFNDLRELKKRLAPLSFRVFPKYGKLDEATFDWLKINADIGLSEGVEVLIKKGLSIKEIVNYLNTEEAKDNSLIYFKKMHLFAIDSHFINLSLVGNSLMEKILEVRFHIEAFNEDVDSFRESLKMTFIPGITEINHDIISNELKNRSLDIAKKSIYIVDKINSIVEFQ